MWHKAVLSHAHFSHALFCGQQMRVAFTPSPALPHWWRPCETPLGRCISGGLCTQDLFPQLFQQCLRLLQVGGVKAFGKPAVYRREQRVGRGPLPLLLPPPAQACCGAQLPRFGLLVAGNGESLVETGFSPGHLWNGLAQQQLALEPIGVAT